MACKPCVWAVSSVKPPMDVVRNSSCGDCGDDISTFERVEYENCCFICFLERQRSRVERDLKASREHTARSSHPSPCAAISVIDASGSIGGLPDYTIDLTVKWDLARKRLIAALICANPYLDPSLMAKLEAAQFTIGHSPVKSCATISKAFAVGPVQLNVDLDGSVSRG